MKNWNNALFLFAHPDDEVLAAGATIARMISEGIEVRFVFPFTGVHARKDVPQLARDKQLIDLRRDCFNALRCLGYEGDDVVFGNFPDNQGDTVPRLELFQWVEDQLRGDEGIVFTHHAFCANIDHRRCHEAAMIATRPFQSRVNVVSCEVPSSTGYLRPAYWEPNLYSPVSPRCAEVKRHAMRQYRGEVRTPPHPRSPEAIEAHLRVRGSECGAEYAEAFMLSRGFL